MRDVVSVLFMIVAFKFCGIHPPTALQFLKKTEGRFEKTLCS